MMKVVLVACFITIIYNNICRFCVQTFVNNANRAKRKLKEVEGAEGPTKASKQVDW